MPIRRRSFLFLAFALVSASPADAQVAEGPPQPPQPPRLERPTAAPIATRPAPAARPTGMDRPPTGMDAAAPPASPVAPAGYSAAAPAENPPRPRGAIAARVLARVNGQPILFEEVLNAAGLELESIRPQVPEEQWASVRQEGLTRRLDFMIDTEVLIQDAANRVQPKVLQKFLDENAKDFDKKLKAFRDKMKFASDAEMKKKLEAQGYSLEEMRRQYARNMVAVQYFTSTQRDAMEMIDREEMLEYYKTHPKEFERPELMTWQNIFLDVNRFQGRTQAEQRLAAKQHAEQLHQIVFAMKNREDFAPLAKKHSHGQDAPQGGEAQDPPGQIRPPEALRMLERLVPGQTGPLIETPAGFHIVRLVAHQKAGLVPFPEACSDIKNKITNGRWEAELAKTTKLLRAKATIESGLGKAKE